MGPPARALLVATLAAARPVTDVASCRAHVLQNLAAAGNVEDGQWATLVCAPEHLPPAAAATPANPPAEVFEGLMCPREGAAPDAAPPAAREMAVTLGKFFFNAATHPKYAAARRFDYAGWRFLPETCGAEGWFRAASCASEASLPQNWQPPLLWWTAAAVRTRLRLLGPCAERQRNALLATRARVAGPAASPACVAVHIRRGDACQVFGGAPVEDKRRCFPTRAYVAAARRLARRYGLGTVRVASDSPAAIREFTATMGGGVAVEALRFDRRAVGGPENATLGLTFAAAQAKFIETRPDAPDAALAAASLLADLEHLASCDAFVGTWEATLSRLAILNLAARAGSLPPFIWLDAPNDRRAWGPRRGRLRLPGSDG